MPTSNAVSTFKQQAHALIDQLPDSASWDDLAYEMDVRASIERGLADSEAERLIAVEDLMKELGIPERRSTGPLKRAPQLLDIQAYVAQDSPMAARRVTARLLRRSRKLAEPPLTGRTVPEYPASDLREVLERPFRLIHRVVVERQQIDIVTVKHHRQKRPPRPEQLGG